MASKLRGQHAGEKMRIAVRLQRETTMTLPWTPNCLPMRAPGHIAHLLYSQGRKEVACGNSLFSDPYV
jgi:hypothetical protein